MTTRETSIEAYHRVKESGLLSELRLRVYEILCHHGPMTAGEMLEYTNKKIPHSGVYTTRFSELQRWGAIKEVDKRPCKTTGFTAIVWGITGDLPVKPEKTPTRKEKKTAIMNNLVAHGLKPTPSTAEDIEIYKEELREIYRGVRDL